MKEFKVIKRNIKPSEKQMMAYRKSVGSTSVRNTNLRYNQLAFMTDADLDG